VAVVDTNCDPDLVDYVIPGNDDALRAIRSSLHGCRRGAGRKERALQKELEEEKLAAEREAKGLRRARLRPGDDRRRRESAEMALPEQPLSVRRLKMLPTARARPEASTQVGDRQGFEPKLLVLSRESA